MIIHGTVAGLPMAQQQLASQESLLTIACVEQRLKPWGNLFT